MGAFATQILTSVIERISMFKLHIINTWDSWSQVPGSARDWTKVHSQQIEGPHSLHSARDQCRYTQPAFKCR